MKFVEVPFYGNTIVVSSDYYMEDGVRTPLSYPDALDVVKEYGCRLPTPEEVDAIWAAADLKLKPIFMTPGPQMTSPDYFIRHSRMIDEQIDGREFNLVAGHKKDIVQQQRKGRVTIYGWHTIDGAPIQPVSSVHGDYYYDYSHGVRLVKV